ncbi:MAG TPA: amino acid-binding protein [Gammaproteobacteria bacterium]|nr:amino acid-binding protein [Gammaproteobacteria bacterium]
MTDKNHWYMLTLIGKDRPGIVAHVSSALFEGGANLGEASMIRLGGNFTIMLMVQFAGNLHALHELIDGVAESLSLHVHLDHIEGQLHDHLPPDVRISVYGADRAGIVAKVTGVLAEAGLHILDLESDVAGTEAEPVYIMTIEGHASEGIPALESALAIVKQEGIDASLEPIDIMLG